MFKPIINIKKSILIIHYIINNKNININFFIITNQMIIEICKPVNTHSVFPAFLDVFLFVCDDTDTEV